MTYIYIHNKRLKILEASWIEKLKKPNINKIAFNTCNNIIHIFNN